MLFQLFSFRADNLNIQLVLILLRIYSYRTFRFLVCRFLLLYSGYWYSEDSFMIHEGTVLLLLIIK